jgi:hypothetical protein
MGGRPVIFFLGPTKVECSSLDRAAHPTVNAKIKSVTDEFTLFEEDLVTHVTDEPTPLPGQGAPIPIAKTIILLVTYSILDPNIILKG